MKNVPTGWITRSWMFFSEKICILKKSVVPLSLKLSQVWQFHE
jgi:hypothetical protein